MKKMKHGGKARKTHKRMQDGGMADYGEAARPMAYSRGKVGTSAFRPVGRPDFIPSPGVGGNLKPGMRPLASSNAYMRNPGIYGGMSDVAQTLAGSPVRPDRGGSLKPGMRPLASSDAFMRRPGRGGAMTDAPPRLAGRPEEIAATPFRKGGAVKSKKMRGGGLARKGVGMALAKGGLAKRAGGCAKRGVGRGKMV
jgi:hypothetical protein